MILAKRRLLRRVWPRSPLWVPVLAWVLWAVIAFAPTMVGWFRVHLFYAPANQLKNPEWVEGTGSPPPPPDDTILIHSMWGTREFHGKRPTFIPPIPSTIPSGAAPVVHLSPTEVFKVGGTEIKCEFFVTLSRKGDTWGEPNYWEPGATRRLSDDQVESLEEDWISLMEGGGYGPPEISSYLIAGVRARNKKGAPKYVYISGDLRSAETGAFIGEPGGCTSSNREFDSLHILHTSFFPESAEPAILALNVLVADEVFRTKPEVGTTTRQQGMAPTITAIGPGKPLEWRGFEEVTEIAMTGIPIELIHVRAITFDRRFTTSYRSKDNYILECPQREIEFLEFEYATDHPVAFHLPTIPGIEEVQQVDDHMDRVFSELELPKNESMGALLGKIFGIGSGSWMGQEEALAFESRHAALRQYMDEYFDKDSRYEFWHSPSYFAMKEHGTAFKTEHPIISQILGRRSLALNGMFVSAIVTLIWLVWSVVRIVQLRGALHVKEYEAISFIGTIWLYLSFGRHCRFLPIRDEAAALPDVDVTSWRSLRRLLKQRIARE